MDSSCSAHAANSFWIASDALDNPPGTAFFSEANSSS